MNRSKITNRTAGSRLPVFLILLLAIAGVSIFRDAAISSADGDLDASSDTDGRVTTLIGDVPVASAFVP